MVGLTKGGEAGGESGWVGATEAALEDDGVLAAEGTAPAGGAGETVGAEAGGGGAELGEGVEDDGFGKGLTEGGEAGA